jgi:putative endonuclease
MPRKNLDAGRSGEIQAADFLRMRGYKIIAQNYKTPLGEIDIVARDKDTYCFVEVKTRRSDKFGLPQEAVSRFKQRQISKAALSFLKDNLLMDKKSRFDVVSIMHEEFPRIELIKNAFDLDESFTL